jgi:hypothetical protein
MKKLLLILLCLPMIGFGQQTYVPDDNFEAYLEANGMGNGIPNDDYVTTANINTISQLQPYNLNISDLTGIEDFTSLISFICIDNQLTSLDLSNNLNLLVVNAHNNLLTTVDLRNGNNLNLSMDCTFLNNPSLFCIYVDLPAHCDTTLTVVSGNIDPQHYFSNNCSGTSIQEQTTNKELLKVTDLLGRETNQTNQPLFYIYDDGTVEKKIIIE